MTQSLPAGAELSHYRIARLIGAGGMGQVYEASDLTLGRSVALKILPPSLVRDPQRVRRFVQEARTASSLNHPHIVTIYEVGEAGDPNGGSDPVRFIAMELIDGDTLSAKFRGSDGLRTLLGWLWQVAQGVAKAHEAGIVHRDLKPDNIIITRDGYAKVLDFGLAKLVERRQPSPDAVTAAPETDEGMILGTPAYMSPEQVMGRPADHRSDVFSFGCILYEAATRKRAFDSGSDIDVMHKIVHDAPEPVERLNANVPDALRRVIRRCVSKETAQRFQSMKDLGVTLGELYEDFDALTITSSGAPAPADSARAFRTPQRSRRLWTAAAVFAAIAIGAGVWTWRHHARDAGSGLNLDRMRIERMTSAGSVWSVAISRDGKYLVHDSEIVDGKWALWLKQIATGSEVKLVESGGALGSPVFSNDGSYIYYLAQDPGSSQYGSLYQVPALGGNPRKLIFDVDTGPAFSPGGDRLAFIRGIQPNKYAIVIANADGSGSRVLAVYYAGVLNQLASPAWSPDGKRIAFVKLTPGAGLQDELATIDVATGEERIVSKRWRFVTHVAWLTDDRLAITASNEGHGGVQLWVIDKRSGRETRVTNGLDQYFCVSVTADGKALAAIQLVETSMLYAGNLPEPLTPADLLVLDVDATDSGVVFSASRNDKTDLWALDSASHALRRLTDDGTARRPSVSRDESAIVFVSRRGGGVSHVWRIDRDGGNATQLTRSNAGEAVGSISPDGRWFSYVAGNSLWRQSFKGGGLSKLASDVVTMGLGGAGIRTPSITRDGKLALFLQTVRLETGRSELRWTVSSTVDGTVVSTIDPLRDTFLPHWTPDENHIAAARYKGPMNIWSMSLAGRSPLQLTNFPSGVISDFDWSDDGRTLFIARGSHKRDVVVISDFQ